MLEDLIINTQLSYSNHHLIFNADDDNIQIGGVLGAALLCALIVDTQEGDKRQITIDTDAERRAWIQTYEREVRREEWGLLDAELQLLSDAYIQITTSHIKWTSICPNIRLLDLAMRLVVFYMRYLTIEAFGAHIWEGYPWEIPFAQWLYNAAHYETIRQRFLHTDWSNDTMVIELALDKNQTNQPTFFFENEDAQKIMKQYLQWRWKDYQAQLAAIPGAQPRAPKHRNYIFNQESDWTAFNTQINQLSSSNQQLWVQWLIDWQKLLKAHIKPEKPLSFWTKEVSELQQQQLTQYLRIQEKNWDYYKSLATVIYALRQLGYIRYQCSVTDITRWLADNMVKDYTIKNNRDQFRRAWKELGRYSEDVQDAVNELAQWGITRLITRE